MGFRARVVAVRDWLRREYDPDARRARALVRRGLVLPPCPRSRRVKGSVWAVTMVKNEADIIEDVVRHLFAQGVTGVLVSDNGSTDETPAILRRLASEFNLHLAQDHEPAYYQQHKMTRLSQWAARAGADWIIPFDADEFWLAPGQRLADWLPAQRHPMVRARIHNVFPSPRGWAIDPTPHPYPKVAFRTHPLARLHQGNHFVDRPGGTGEGLVVVHQPWRSYAQFAGKLRNGAAAYQATTMAEAGQHWRSAGALPEDELKYLWDDLAAGHDQPIAGWTPTSPLVPVDNHPHWTTWAPQGALRAALTPAVSPSLSLVLPSGPLPDPFVVAARTLSRLLGAALETAQPSLPVAALLAPDADSLARARRALGSPKVDARGMWVLGSEELPFGADALYVHPVRTDRRIDLLFPDAAGLGVEALIESAVREGLTVHVGVPEFPLAAERRRGLWALLRASKVVFTASPTDPYLVADARACGTIVAGAAGDEPAGVVDVGRADSVGAGAALAGLVRSWTPDVATARHRLALTDLDWRWRADALRRHLRIASPVLDHELSQLRGLLG